MPDALSKTIPIWCAVLNQLLFQCGEVIVPAGVIGPSEQAQMQALLYGWVENAKVCYAIIETWIIYSLPDNNRLST